MRKGLLLVAVGVGMVIFDLTIKPVFSLPIAEGFAFPVGLLAILVGALYVMSARIAIANANLTPKELAEWGDALERATPRIIELSEQQWATGAIAKAVEKETRIPQDVLIKYMYAMRRYLEGVRADAHTKQRRTL